MNPIESPDKHAAAYNVVMDIAHRNGHVTRLGGSAAGSPQVSVPSAATANPARIQSTASQLHRKGPAVVPSVATMPNLNFVRGGPTVPFPPELAGRMFSPLSAPHQSQHQPPPQRPMSGAAAGPGPGSKGTAAFPLHPNGNGTTGQQSAVSAAQRNTRIACPCGRNVADPRTRSVQCEGVECGTWQHATCMGLPAMSARAFVFFL